MFTGCSYALRRSVVGKQLVSTTPGTKPSRREVSVVLDNDTLYLDRSTAEALGWQPDTDIDQGIQLTMRGWVPNYFIISKAGSDGGK